MNILGGNPVAALFTGASSLFTKAYHHTDYIERNIKEDNTTGTLKTKRPYESDSIQDYFQDSLTNKI